MGTSVARDIILYMRYTISLKLYWLCKMSVHDVVHLGKIGVHWFTIFPGEDVGFWEGVRHYNMIYGTCDDLLRDDII